MKSKTLMIYLIYELLNFKPKIEVGQRFCSAVRSFSPLLLYLHDCMCLSLFKILLFADE